MVFVDGMDGPRVLSDSNNRRYKSDSFLAAAFRLRRGNKNQWQSVRRLENKVDLAWANRNRWQGVRGLECKVDQLQSFKGKGNPLSLQR